MAAVSLVFSALARLCRADWRVPRSAEAEAPALVKMVVAWVCWLGVRDRNVVSMFTRRSTILPGPRPLPGPWANSGEVASADVKRNAVSAFFMFGFLSIQTS